MRDYGYMTASTANIDATTKKPHLATVPGGCFLCAGSDRAIQGDFLRPGLNHPGGQVHCNCYLGYPPPAFSAQVYSQGSTNRLATSISICASVSGG